MIKIDTEMPENCANCPMIVPVKNGLMTEYLCRIRWNHIDRGHIYVRQEWCPIKEDRTEND